MNEIITKKEVEGFRDECDASVSNRLSENEIREMILCDRQRNEEIAAGKPYYDYDAQKWVNET